jgi:cell division protein FtsW (lipid II flippase)
MPAQTENPKADQSRRHIELRLLLFALLIVGFGMSLTFLGKLSTNPPLPNNAVNVNQADAAQLESALNISRQTADSVVALRDTLPHHQFASSFRLRRALTKADVAYTWDWERLYVRSESDVARVYFGALIAFILVALLIHFVLKKVVPAADPFLLPIIVVLSGFGLMVSLSVHDPLRDTFAFNSQAIGVIVCGSIAILVPLLRPLQRLPLHRYTYAYAVGSVLLLITLMTLGHGPAATHIQLFGFEPIEIIKVLLIFFIAAYLAERRMSQGDKLPGKIYLPGIRDTLPLIAIYIFALSLFGAVKDLGPAVLLFGSFVAMLYLVTGRVVYPLIGFILLMAAAYVGDTLGIGFFATRVEMWLHPWANSDRLGGQLAQGLWGLGTGGIAGSGLGLGGASYVPRAGSDMVFTTLGEETGLIGALCILCLYVMIIFRGFQIARAAIDDFDRLLSSGITVLIGLQAFVIAGGATGVMPLTGITLPFVAYGTSSLVANYFCVGMLLHISAKSRTTNFIAVTPPIFVRSSRRVAVALSGGLLLIIGVGRLGWLQGVDDLSTATHNLRIPDADRVFRDHRNPRLVAYAASIHRGTIRDRNGVLLAGNASPGEGVTYLTGGIPRVYPLGAIGADIVDAVEQPESPTDPLGSDQALRGYGSLEDLLPLYQRKDLPFPPTPQGSDVDLTLDIGLQKTAQEALDRSVRQFGDGRGAVVVLDCKTGAVLAAATAPTFDPNALTDDSWAALHTSADSANPLLNRAFAGDYPPGSVFKLVTATAAFQQHKDGLIFECHHTLAEIRWHFNEENYERRHITDDEEFVPHGVTDMAKAIRVSCNVYFAQLGVAIGAEPLERVFGRYNFNACPSLQTLGEDLPDCAYGQGTILVTPYQMARVCQTIGNNGVEAPNRFFLNVPSQVSPTRVLRASDAEQLTQMMAGVVTTGTAAGVFDGLSVAGKTGSAQLAKGQPHSWFVGFAPVENPSIAFACIVEHGGHGRTAAAPVCRDIVAATLR